MKTFIIDLMPLFFDLSKNESFRIPGKNKNYLFPVYDIAKRDDDNLIFSLYQNNKICSIDYKNNICFLPITVKQCHGIYIYKKLLICSCFRRSKIHLFDLETNEEITCINLPGEYPIAAIVSNKKLFYIDYYHSKLKYISLIDFKTKKDISNLIAPNLNPHSIKIHKDIICITSHNPSKLTILKNFKNLHTKYFPKEFCIMSALPLDSERVLIIFIRKGIYLYNTKTNNLFLISDSIPSPTSLSIIHNDLFIVSESSYKIYRIQNWNNPNMNGVIINI